MGFKLCMWKKWLNLSLEGHKRNLLTSHSKLRYTFILYDPVWLYCFYFLSGFINIALVTIKYCVSDTFLQSMF